MEEQKNITIWVVLCVSVLGNVNLDKDSKV